MATFSCHDKCDRLCKPKAQASPSKYDSVVDLAGLTKDEMALVVQFPREAKIVYDQVQLAQSMTEKRFGRDWYAESLKKADKLTVDEIDRAALKSLVKSELTVIRKLGGPKK